MNNMTVLKRLRLINGCSQQDVADNLQIERSTYAKWESKNKDLTFSQLYKIATYYEIGIIDLIQLLVDES